MQTPDAEPALELAEEKRAAPARRRRECCVGWDEISPEEKAQWPWRALHELSHGRVPFSADTFSEIARVPRRTARDILSAARRVHWVVPSGAPADRIYFGQLPKKR